MKKIFALFITVILAVSSFTLVYAADDLQFEFILQVDGGSFKNARYGDIITVSFTIDRTDSDTSYTMYSFQNEIRYDSDFFEIVDGSFIMKSGIVTKNIAVSERNREQYINYLSKHGGDEWSERTVVGSFQLKVKARSGTSVIDSMDCQVSKSDGRDSYAVTKSNVIVSVSEDCTVSFDTGGGAVIEPVTVKLGDTLKKPENPTRSGYTFTGWYTDEKCNERWSFSQNVQHNMTLYAGWAKKGISQDSGSVVVPDAGDGSDKKDNIFLDIGVEDWFYESVMYCYGNGIMNGMSENTFGPSLNTTRAMIATMIWRLDGEEKTAGSSHSFADVAEGQWYSEAISWAAKNGIVKGYSEYEFGPDDSITREQMVTMLWRYVNYKGIETEINTGILASDFADYNDTSEYAKEAIVWSVGSGMINGVDKITLLPGGFATRAQIATMFMRFHERIKQ